MPNLPAIQAALAEVVAHPEHHDQAFWSTLAPGSELLDASTKLRDLIAAAGIAQNDVVPLEISCGTSSCLAGIAVEQAGYLFTFDGANRIMSYVRHVDPVTGQPDSEMEYAPNVADRLFDLDTTQSRVLYDADNRKVDLWAAAFAITSGELDLSPAIDEFSVKLDLDDVIDVLEAWASEVVTEDDDVEEDIAATRQAVASSYFNTVAVSRG